MSIKNIKGIKGSIGTQGTIGPQGTTGTQRIQGITDWKDDMMKKYNNRFTIKTEYDEMTFYPITIIIDTNTNQEYKFKQSRHPNSLSYIMNETDNFIKELIITDRDIKINTVLNATKD